MSTEATPQPATPAAPAQPAPAAQPQTEASIANRDRAAAIAAAQSLITPEPDEPAAPAEPAAGEESTEPAAEPEPEPQKPDKPTLSDDELLARIRAQGEARRKREAERRQHQQEVERARAEAAEKAKQEAARELQEKIRADMLRDPSQIIRDKADLEALTKRILDSEGSRTSDEKADLLAQIQQLKDEMAKELQAIKAKDEEREKANRVQAAEAGYLSTVKANSARLPLLSRLPADKALAFTYECMRTDPNLQGVDDATIALYTENQLRSLQKLLSEAAPEDEGQKTDPKRSAAPRRSPGATLSNEQAATRSAAPPPVDPIKAAYAEALKKAKELGL